jgi:formylglycine-generating enzyme required for sulfatase activity
VSIRARCPALAAAAVVAAAAACSDPRREDASPSGETGRTTEWVTIKAGTFKMGSPADEPGRFDIEPQHDVTLTSDFMIQTTEVTQEQFESVMGYNPSHFRTCGPTCPVEDLTWHEAAAYANELSKRSELFPLCYGCSGSGRTVTCQRNASHATPYECPGYRLPTEAEWEYAARAGDARSTYTETLTSRYLGCLAPNPVLDPIAWFCGNSQRTPHPVGSKRPNAWGLYDVLGNVWEWTHDWGGAYPTKAVTDPWGPSTGFDRIGRGGSWINEGQLLRLANRGGGSPDGTYGFIGVRLVKTVF